MIPIVSILSLVSGLLSFFICFRLWRRSVALRNLIMRQFAYCYFFFGLFFLFFVAPGTIHTNGTLIAVDAALAYLSLFVTIAYFIQIPLELFKQFFWAKFIFWLTVLSGSILFIGNIIYLEAPLVISRGPFVYYLIQGNPLIQLLNELIPVVFDVIGIIFFISQGYYLAQQAKSSQDNSAETRSVTYRSYNIAAGWSILLVAGALNIYGSAPAPKPIAIFLATAVSVVGLLVVYRGIYRMGSSYSY